MKKSRPAGRAYGGQTADARLAERRAKLIAAGIELFGTQGYHATTVRAVCAQAGLTERYFYESFENGEALLCAVYEQLIAQMMARVQQALAAAPRDADAMAAAALRVWYQTNRDPRVARIVLFEVLGVSPHVDQLYRQAMEAFALLIRAVYESMFPERPPLAGRDESLVADGLVGAMVQIAMRWVLAGYQQPIDNVVRSALTLFTAVTRHLLEAPGKSE